MGTLLWLSNQTRPYISNAVRVVAIYTLARRLKHWLAATGVLEYLKMTNSYGNTIQRGRGLELMVYANAAYAPKATMKRSVSDGAEMCGGASIQLVSRTQESASLSTSEAEYVGMANVFNEALSLRSVWRYIFPEFEDSCIHVFGDNTGAIQMVRLDLETHRFMSGTTFGCSVFVWFSLSIIVLSFFGDWRITVVY